MVFAHNNNRLSPFFKLKCSYGFPDTAGSANNQTGLADKFRSHIPERSPIYSNVWKSRFSLAGRSVEEIFNHS